MIHRISGFLLWPGLLVLLLAGSLTLALTRPTPQVNIDRDWSSGSQHPVTDETAQAGVLETYGNLPLSFIANRGQTDSRVRFTARGAGHTFYFTPTEIVFDAIQRPSDQAEAGAKFMTLADELRPDEPVQRAVVRMRFLGANPEPVVEGLEELPGRANFFIGNDPTKWQTDVPTYRAIAYRDLYPGVDLIYRGSQGRLKSEFRVAPGADPGVIRLGYAGMEALTLTDAGQLVLRTPLGELVEEAPYVYQEVAGERVEVTGRFQLVDERTMSFVISAYDPTLPLVIDPVLAYSTYLGGSAGDSGLAIAVDSVGNAYVTGYAWSINFPLVNPLRASARSREAFVTKINPASGTLIYSTYLGGWWEDQGYSIAVDNAGNAYVIGETGSRDFPTVNPIQENHAGLVDMFIAKISASGGGLVFSTFFGGSGVDYGDGIAVDGEGNVYLTGTTDSADFPTINPIQESRAGDYDVFITKIAASGSVLLYSTYLGGSDDYDRGNGIAVDSAGSAYVTGYTRSTDFPTANPIQGSYAGGERDAFVTKIDASGSALVYSTYLGGNDWDASYGIAVDSAGNAYVTGDTSSTDFPTANPIQGSYAGGNYGDAGDAFVTKIDASGSALLYSTYLGGSGHDRVGYLGNHIAVDSTGNAYVTGSTTSLDFPLANPIQGANAGSGDVFVTKIDASGNALVYSTYLGGSDGDGGWGIAVDGAGSAYVTGSTGSTDFPTVNPAQDFGGRGDAFVVKIRTFGAQLSIDKLASGGPPWLPGEPVQYAIQMSNVAAAYDDAQDVHMDDLVSSSLTVTGVSCTDGTCSHAVNDVNWDIPTLAVGASASLTITAAINPDVEPGTTIENCAVATSPTDPDPPFPACVSFTTAVADLSISKAATGTNLPWMPGEPVRYTVQVSDAADAELEAQNVHLDDLVPSSLTVTGLLCSTGTCNYTGNDVDWDISTLPIGQTVTMTIDTTINAGIPLTTTVENCATITSPTDPDPPPPACYSFVAVNCPANECGKVKEDTTWAVANSPYIVIGDLIINEGVALRIEPGVEVRFATTDAISFGEDPDKVELIVAGTLVADGVTFTSNADSPAAGDWYGIRFLPSSTDWDGTGGSIITNSTIEYGTVGISIAGASPMISSNVVTDMKGDDGIDGSTYDDSCDRVDGEDSYGIYVTNDASPTIERNAVSSISGGVGGFCRYYIYGGFYGNGGDAIGIYVADSASPSIAHNDISVVNAAGASGLGAGIYVVSASSGTIRENKVSMVKGGRGMRGASDGGIGAGIYIGDASSLTVESNTVFSITGGTGANGWTEGFCRGGTATGDGGVGTGIYTLNSSSLNIINNVISEISGGVGGKGNPGCYDGTGGPGGKGGIGAGIYSANSTFLGITNNIIAELYGGNGGEGVAAANWGEYPPVSGGNGGAGIGIYAEPSSATLMNNTILSSAGGQGGAPGDPSGLLERRVGDSTDDAQEFANGNYDDSGPSVLLGDDNGSQNYVGFRFYEYIPQGAIIDSAVLTVTAYDDRSGITQFLIKGEATGNSPTFSADDSPRDRTPTAAGVIWSVTEPWAQGQTYSSPDLSAVIQEIVNRDDWRLGSALTLLVLDVEPDNQNRTVSTVDGDYDKRAELATAWHWPEAVSGKRGEDGIGVGVNVGASSTVTATNNIVVSHTIGISGTTTTATLSYNDVWGNSQADYAGLPPGPNDVSVDPLFRHPAGDDYHLCAGSPLIDAGTNQDAPATDVDGDARPYDGDNDGAALTDIGADEWLPGPAFLTVLPPALDFVGTVGRSDPEPQGIDVFNCGNRDSFQWTAETDGPWLHVCPLSGVTTGTATVFVDTGGLSMGWYRGAITVTSQTSDMLNSPQTVPVTLKVVPLGDMDEDCDVDVTDVMGVVSGWRARQGDPNYLKAGDVNDDGVINIVDIQKVVAQWGVICPQGYGVAEARKAVDDASWCGQRLLELQEEEMRGP
jgi:hypothetical protein